MSNTLQALIRINYKSGISQEFWFDKFEMERNGSEVMSIKSDMADEGFMPMMFGLDNIESVFQIAVRPKEGL